MNRKLIIFNIITLFILIVGCNNVVVNNTPSSKEKIDNEKLTQAEKTAKEFINEFHTVKTKTSLWYEPNKESNTIETIPAGAEVLVEYYSIDLSTAEIWFRVQYRDPKKPEVSIEGWIPYEAMDSN